MNQQIDWYSSEKYVDLLLYLKHKDEKPDNIFCDDNTCNPNIEEKITFNQWFKYCLAHSSLKKSALGRFLVKVKRKLGIRFY